MTDIHSPNQADMEQYDDAPSATLRRYSPSPSPVRGRSMSRSRSRSRSRSPAPRDYVMDVDRPRRPFSRSRSRSRSPGRSRYSRDRSPRTSQRYKAQAPPREARDNPDPSAVLGIFNLAFDTSKDELQDIFTPFGSLEKVTIVNDRRTGRSRGFGFVYFRDVDAAARAREETNGMRLKNREIRVDYSVTRDAHQPTPGMYMGDPEGRTDRDGASRPGRRDQRDQRHRRRSRSRSYSRSRSRSRGRYSSSSRRDRNRNDRDRYSRDRSPPRSYRRGRSRSYSR